MKLQIGCFNVPFRGWYNTDITEHLWIARVPGLAFLLHTLGMMNGTRYQEHQQGIFRTVHYMHAAKRFPFNDRSVEAVYSSQMFPNLTLAETKLCLKEIHRVLKSGGIFRVSVTNLDTWIREYDPMDPDKFLSLLFLPSIKREKNHIHWMYNEHSLRRLLEEAGFKNIMACEMFQGKCPDVKMIDYRTDAVFMEAEK